MSASDSPATPRAKRPRRIHGVGAVLVFVYAILAIGATSRAIYQIATVFDKAPLPITLSAVSGVIYILATVALILPAPAWYRVAWVTISFELLGVLVIGTLSIVDPVFAGSAKISDGTVWSYYGRGYVFIPVILPILGMLWLSKHRPEPVASALVAPVAGAGA
jgi:hypothetical protein